MLAFCCCMAAIIALIAPTNEDYRGLEQEVEEA